MLTTAQSWVVGVISSATRRRAEAARLHRIARDPASTTEDLRRALEGGATMLESCAHLDEAVTEVFGGQG